MSDLGSLAHCLVDNDSEALGRARWLRTKGLAISIVLEAFLVAAMLLWPLITPGVLPRQFVLTPAPPFRGGNPNQTHSHVSAHPATPLSHPPLIHGFFQPPHIPKNWKTNPIPDAPNIDLGPSEGMGIGPGAGGGSEFIPGGSDAGNQALLPRPPETVHHNGPLHVSTGVMEASLIRRVQPVYPPLARVMHLSGTVRLRALVGTDGNVRQLEVLSGSPILAQAALAAVREWRYRPTLLNNEAGEVETYITVNFVLE